MRDVKELAAYRRARDRFMGEGPRPASTLVEVSKLVSEDFLIEVEAIAAA
jgi:enamine deaminase RidA (YjgF/YER057c/UK114 family)